MGRPSTYTPERAQAICWNLTEGESLRTICNKTDAPTRTTVYRWLEDNEEFRDQYARARERYAELEGEELIALSELATPQNVQCIKLQIDTRKWILSKWLPKKYGDRAALEVTGEGGGPISVSYDPAFNGV